MPYDRLEKVTKLIRLTHQHNPMSIELNEGFKFGEITFWHNEANRVRKSNNSTNNGQRTVRETLWDRSSSCELLF